MFLNVEELCGNEHVIHTLIQIKNTFKTSQLVIGDISNFALPTTKSHPGLRTLHFAGLEKRFVAEETLFRFLLLAVARRRNYFKPFGGVMKSIPTQNKLQK